MPSTPPLSLSIQSVLYGNSPLDTVRSAQAVAQSARLARERGTLSDWSYALGDGLADAARPDGHLERLASIVESAGGAFSYLHFGSNLGHGGGHNELARGADTAMLLFLNPDGILDPGALDVLLGAVDETVGAGDARQLPIEHPKDYDSTTGDTSWASGACLMTPRSVFEAVGGFDHESFFLYGDDVDYSWRVRLAGRRVVHVPDARMFHDKRLTTSGDSEVGEADHVYSPQASLLLAHKYSRPDILRGLRADFLRGGNPYRAAAVADFDAREAAGRLPEPLDADHSVAQFVSGNYARHRY